MRILANNMLANKCGPNQSAYLTLSKEKIHVNVKGGRRKLKDCTMIHLHTNLDNRTQRRQSEVHVRGQWDEEDEGGNVIDGEWKKKNKGKEQKQKS